MKQIIRSFRSPAYVLAIETARENWGLILANILTNFLSVLLEGSTIGLIYLAVAYLTVTRVESSVPENIPAILEKLSAILKLPREQMFLVLVLMAVLFQILLSLSNYSNKVATALFSAKAQPYVTGKVFERILTLSYGCVSQYKVGDLVMFSNDAALAVDRQITAANNFFISLSFSLVYLLIIVRLSPTLAIASIMLTMVVAFVQYRLIPRLRRIVKRVNATQVESAKYITESIQALRLIHTYGTQRSTMEAVHARLDKTREQLQKRAFIFYLPEPILDTIPIIVLAILAISAVILNSQQANVLALLLTFLLALQRLSVRIKALAGTVTVLTDNNAKMFRLETILASQGKTFEQSGSLLFSHLQTDIEFKNVSLSYFENFENETLALRDLTFKIPYKKVTAFVGESGAGKSSIVDLLIGLYRPTSGQILVNGNNLDQYGLADWRSRIGVVSQDTFIFNNSILENLQYGRPSATLEEVIEAAKAAQAHRFILALPEGYETIVGERGYRLSGGQRQRLALARALIKQPDILILDEATSALDSESEKLIQEALDQFQSDRTVIVVAHRLSTIAGADQIIVLENGNIAEQGTHHALVGQGRRYARYWSLQSSAVAG
ncbi:MAG: ABC transporter ATP-binding protein [Phormidesmis sp. RL_2_1]|nr:ABC transporter ATP-binding protein [Phormidesmis sp. RL_2_1]